MPVSHLFFHRFAAAARNSLIQLHRLALRLSAVLFATGLVLSILSALAARPLVRLVFGESYQTAAIPFMILTPVILARLVFLVPDTVAAVLRTQTRISLTLLGGTAVFLVTGKLAYDFHGLTGFSGLYALLYAGAVAFLFVIQARTTGASRKASVPPSITTGLGPS